jgi:energy-coupling factor transporter ATP-binding protein EcfA2
MGKEWYQYCKDCRREYGYSDSSYQGDLRRGNSRPERCPEHRKQHSLEIKSIASSHFGLVPKTASRSILGEPYLGHVDHGKRDLRSKELQPDPSGMDIGITDENIHEVYSALEECQVLVIVGPTGSGKSTYVPYRLLNPLPPYEKDHFTQRGPIVVTQPRIQATSGLPNTVGKKLLGSSVGPGFEIGYRHGDRTGKGGGDHYDPRNRLVFVTDGSLLNWIADGKIGDFSIVMIDEAHERSCNIDLILGLIKRELLKYEDLKLIVASATIDAESFVNYYKDTTSVRLLEFEGRRTKDYDRHWWTGKEIDQRDLPSKVAEFTIKILSETDEGGILGFLPGKDEIERSVELIRRYLKDRKDIRVFPLYTALGVQRGREALKPLDQVHIGGHLTTPRRVVIATNIAETSVTIPDVAYVIDSGLIKQTYWNPSTCRQELLTRYHSKDGCKQRWGRAGRTRHGDVFTLYTQEQYDSFLDHTAPEITRDSLDDILLTAKASGIGDLANFSWIEKPPDDEMSRAVNVIRRRELVDGDDDLTEEGFELYRLSRVVSRFLDKYDYNSTKRALDVATLLLLADQYACLIEAATVLAMMPRMGDALYWIDDGLLQWDRWWDLESKDKVSRLQRSLRIGCVDDLDFACKLFALYEQDIKALPAEHRKEWRERYFINKDSFRLVESARAGILEPFTKGRKTSSFRPLDFSLLPRLRILMAVAWPDRLGTIEQNKFGNSPLFTLPDSTEKGIVSRNSRIRTDVKQAVVGIMDRTHAFIDGAPRECPVGNFIVEAPATPPKRRPEELAEIFSGFREGYDEGQVYARMLADQYAPVGSHVLLNSLSRTLTLKELTQLPSLVTPITTLIPDENEEELFTAHDLYEHPDELTALGLIEQISSSNSLAPGKLTNNPASRSASNDVLPPSMRALTAEWVSSRKADEAFIVEWRERDGAPLAFVDAVDQESLRKRNVKKFSLGDRIGVRLTRAISDLDSDRLVGFIAHDEAGLNLPVSIEALTISMQSAGLEMLEGKDLQLDVVGFDGDPPLPLLSLLLKSELDLDEILRHGEAEARVLEIIRNRRDEDTVNMTIHRPGGIVHCMNVRMRSVPQMLVADITPSTNVIVEIKRKVPDEDGFWGIQGPDELDLSAREIEALAGVGIKVIRNRLVCKELLKCRSILPLRRFSPRAYFQARRLYAVCNSFTTRIVETPRTLREFRPSFSSL